MNLSTNASFDRLIAELGRMGAEAQKSPSQDLTYQTFIQRFPAGALRELSLAAYCVGKGDGDSFCWWLERGLEPVLGRYMPGTSRGHMLYFAKDGSVYKHRRLKDLNDIDALHYTLRVQAVLAEADPAQDLGWIDDDTQIYKRAGVEPRVTIGDGRKLRLLAAYHPGMALPISSSDHVAHFLAALGCPPPDIPNKRAPVARMLLLRSYCELARESCPGLTLHGFVKALYADTLGLAPLRDVDEVLGHFAAVPELATCLQAAGQTDVFCQLALALHEAGLDWWVTEAKTIQAGRTDDPKVWQTVVVLALHMSAEGIRLKMNEDDTASQPLDVDVAAESIDAAQTNPRLKPLTHRTACWPDDYDGSDTTLVVQLTAGAIRNGYVKVPKLQALFPATCIAADEKTSAETFKLALPDGTQVETNLLANRGRIRARFNGLFGQSGLTEGDRVVITKEGERLYRLAFKRHDDVLSQTLPASIESKKSTAPVGGLQNMSTAPLNQILYGPPGTGKTYATVSRAVKILNPAFYAQHEDESVSGNREALKREYDRLSSPEQARVRFVTFHQSFSYEDFVEGIRAVTDEVQEDSPSAGGLAYRVEAGVFKRICEDAKRDKASEAQVGIRPDATVWKMSIEEASSDGATRNYCFANGEARLGWENAGDLLTENFEKMDELGSKEKSSLRHFGFNVQPGDVVVCLKTVKTIQAVGVVTGSYEYEPEVPPGVRKDYVHKLPVHWLATGIDLEITTLNGGTQLTLQAVYPLRNISWAKLHEVLLHSKVPLNGVEPTVSKTREPYVLIIDEINRGNVSRIFGELITLLEPSKRAGAPESLEVLLPYSKERFSVPPNVHLIGTMNTADRSLAGLDVALRRRFVFEELMPQHQLLDDVRVSAGAISVSVSELLAVMNQRIEALLDREHTVGHAYFMPLRQSPTLPMLAHIFRKQVLPLLQEYFFDDWERIRWVLNDHRKKAADQTFVKASGPPFESLFGSDVQVPRHRQSWAINANAFDRLDSYAAILNVTLAPPLSQADSIVTNDDDESALTQ
ncbi:MAG: AAA family ATPase [Pseudomonadota bacterium]